MTGKLRILIVEDEPPVARYIERCCRSILGERLRAIDIHHSLKDAIRYVDEQAIDLCLLDLNLQGRNGFELLRSATAGAFHTIIISAHTDQAVEAFKYGVLDFVPKPFEEQDLRSALERYFQKLADGRRFATQFLSSRRGDKHIVFSVDEVRYFIAADTYVEAHLADGRTELLSKSMDRLQQVLPPKFFRIHRSYIVKVAEIQSYTPVIDGTCKVHLKNEETLPLSRRRLKDLRKKLDPC